MHPHLRTKLFLLFLLLVIGGPAFGSGQVAASATRSPIQASKTSLNRIITEYPLPGKETGPVNITKGPDGNLWFTQVYTNQIGKITPNGSLTEYTISHGANSWPEGIAKGPDGNLWFTQIYGNQIGKMTPSGSLTEYALPTAGSQPFGITKGPNDIPSCYGRTIGSSRLPVAVAPLATASLTKKPMAAASRPTTR